MTSFTFKSLIIIALSAVFFSAFASNDNGSCTSEPESGWMPVKDVQAMFEKQEPSVRRTKTGASCYEVYTMNPQGKKTELFVNPANGNVVDEARKP